MWDTDSRKTAKILHVQTKRGSEESAFSEQRQSAALRFIACAKRRAFVATPFSPYVAAARVHSLPKRRCLQHARTLAHQFFCTSAVLAILLPSHMADHVVPAISVFPPLNETSPLHLSLGGRGRWTAARSNQFCTAHVAPPSASDKGAEIDRCGGTALQPVLWCKAAPLQSLDQEWRTISDIDEYVERDE